MTGDDLDGWPERDRELAALLSAAPATLADRESAQSAAVFECYWGNPLELGAAVLGAAWYPGGGLVLAEDEHYAESMTHQPSAFAAACDVMRECVKAVALIAHRVAWNTEGKDAAAGAWRPARDAESILTGRW
jgi:hypothetical protein